MYYNKPMTSFFRRFPMNPALIFCVLYFLLLLLWLGKNRLLGLDESWYADMAKGAVKDGHWFPLYFQGHPFWDKPPLIPWLQSFCLWLFGLKEWALRLPSALAGSGVLFFTWRLCALWGGSEKAGFLAALALGLQPHFILSSRIATLDMPLVFCLSGFAWAWTKALNPRQKQTAPRHLLLAGLFTALGVLIKSWMGLLFLLPALLALLLNPRLPFDRRLLATRLIMPVALALAGWLTLYGVTFGADYFKWEWGFNLGGRVGAHEHPSDIVYYLKFYGVLAQEGMPFLWPLLPLGLSIWIRETWRRRDAALSVGPLFLAAYSLFLIFFMNILINYFLPLMVVAVWGVAFIPKYLAEPGGRLVTGLTLLLALLNGFSGYHYMGEVLALSALLALAPWLPLSGLELSRRWVGALALVFTACVAFKAQDYLRHPPDPNHAWVAAVLKYPAKNPGEPLLFVGEEPDARALEFYSDYAVTCLDQLPSQRPAQALLFKAGPEAVFLPPR
jgi:4-amino-4-deoxy-L-arabinose transferase-like glycosyltransferase